MIEIRCRSLNVVIKAKESKEKSIRKSILDQKSSIRISGLDLRAIKILGEDKIEYQDNQSKFEIYDFKTYPLFFEQTDYEIIVNSTNGEDVALWHENYTVREKITPVLEGKNDLISGIINFGNNAGFSDIEIMQNGRKVLVIKIEVFPSKITYKEDYQAMLEDISNEIYGAILDFMRNTYQEFSIGSENRSVSAIFFEIVKHLYQKFMNAANRIIAQPKHKLEINHPIVAAHKVKKTDKQSIKWLVKNPQNVAFANSKLVVEKAPAVQKLINYNTVENQFVKHIFKTVVSKLKDFKERYIKSTFKPENAVTECVDRMVVNISQICNMSFLKDVDDYKATQSMSLVFEMAPGYRELYKYYLMMLRGLNINGDVFKLSLKDTAQLYEYWCFVKLVSLMKKNYKLASSDIIKIDNSGVTITLVKGKKSDIRFINPRTGERLTLTYNPGEQDTQTVNQKPDNVLTLEKKGANIEYKYIFDAKYRIENNPTDPFYPDENYGPKLSDINAMHRYRDAIVFEKKNPAKFMFERTMFGAYVLFPYDDPENNYVNHRFYKSIETVNIGGLPFLPGTTKLVEDFLSDLVEDSAESAFERASLPGGVEERLAKVDWTVKDVMVGTVRTSEQYKYNIQYNCYYAPKKVVDDKRFPIHFIALHEEGVSQKDGINKYGEVTKVTIKKRKDIPVSTNRKNDDEDYYFFHIKKWVDLKNLIEIKDSSKGAPKFTNKFLLYNCSQSFQLFNIHSGEEYRLMKEIVKAFDKTVVDAKSDDSASYKINSTHTIVCDKGCFIVMTDEGKIVERISLSDFDKHPRSCFNRIKKIIDTQN